MKVLEGVGQVQDRYQVVGKVEDAQVREILEVLEKEPELQAAFGLAVDGASPAPGGDTASRETFKQFFTRWNSEGDRTLSLAEFKGIFGRKYELGNPALVEQLTRRAMERDIGELFSKIDKNHDGRVSKPELILALRRDEALAFRLGLCSGAIKDDSRAALEAFFIEFDSDGDKQLSMEEFSEVFLKSKTKGAKTAAVGTEVIVMPDVGVDPLTVDYLFAKIDKDGKLSRQLILKGQGDAQKDGYFIVGDKLFVVTDFLNAMMALQGGGGGATEEMDEEAEPMEIICYQLP